MSDDRIDLDSIKNYIASSSPDGERVHRNYLGDLSALTDDTISAVPSSDHADNGDTDLGTFTAAADASATQATNGDFGNGSVNADVSMAGTAAAQSGANFFGHDVLLDSVTPDAPNASIDIDELSAGHSHSFKAVGIDSASAFPPLSASFGFTGDAAAQPTVTASAAPSLAVADGATEEIDGASAQSVTFAGTTGTLKLDNSVSFSGHISGLAEADALDLADVHYGSNTTATFSGNMNGGTLAVSDGINTANIALAGDYLGSSWTLSSDGNGGTTVVDPSIYPNASNTGVQPGVSLTTHNGSMTLNTPGQVVSGLIITGGVQITASNVTLENCIIEIPASGNWNIGVAAGLTGVVIKNCEIIGAGSAGPVGTYGIYVQGNSQVTIDSVNMHDVGQGLVLNDGQVTLENSYIHDLHSGSGTHYEDIGYFGAAKSSTFSLDLENNTLINQNNQTASVFIQNYFGAVNNVTVNNNILVGGDYTIYVDGSASSAATTNVSITNNHMGAGIFGVTDFAKSSPTYTGNVNDGATLVAAAGFQSPVVSLASATAGHYSAGNTVTLTLYTSEVVTVGGTPTLTLNDGGTATYTGGAGTNALTFSYTVGNGQSTSALAVTGVNGSIADLDGHALDASSLPATFSGVVIGAASGVPVIASFSTDSGTVGDGITNDNALTLTGTAVANSTVTVYDGATQLGTATANGSGAWSYATGTLANGNHSFTATDTVSGTTSSASSALNVTVDTAAPAKPVIASFSTDSGTVGDGITNDSTLTLTGTAEANAAVKVYDGATLLGSATANGSGAWSYTTAALANGAHSLTATATDAAGNTGTASTALAVTVDTTAPGAPTVVSFSPDTGTVGDGITTANVLTLTGTAEANAAVKVYDGATLLGTATANGSGAWSYTTTSLSTSTHNFTATATDAAGNTGSASAALAVTVTQAAGAPIIASFSTDSGTVGDGITNDNTLTLTGTAVANSTVTVYDGATQLGTATANGSGAWSYATGTLANGSHSFTATDTVSGTTSAASAALSVTVDTTAPAKPVISSFSPDTGTVGDGMTSANVLTLTGTAEANATVKVFDGATQLGTATANGSGAWSYTTAALANGAHNLTATATDVAGNASANSSAMTVTIGAPVNLVTNGGFETGDFTGWTLGGNSGLGQYGPQVYVSTSSHSGSDAAALGSMTTDGTLGQNLQTVAGQQYTLDFWLANSSGGPDDFTVKWNGTSVTALVNAAAQGYTEYTFTVTATSSTSNLEFDSRQDPSKWLLDDISVISVGAQVPGVPTIASFSTDSGTVGDGITNDNTLTLTGTAVANSTVTVYDGATQLGTATANGSGAWSYATGTLANGGHSFTATDTVSGTTSAASAALSVTVDTTAPIVPTIASFSADSGTVGDGITNDNTLTLTGTAEANATVKVYDGATLLGTATANGSGAWSYTTAALADGAHSLTATASDAAGNTSSASSALSVTVDTVAPATPSIASFSTDSGTVGDGITNDNALTLTGTAVADSTVTVYDGATQLGTATANGSGAWNYTTAALANGAHNLTATASDAAGNTSLASSALNVTVDTAAPAKPVIASFSTDSGTVGDGITNDSTLTLTGTAEANAAVKVYDGATLLGSATANGSGAWSYTTAALANGAHSLTATATDAAGNTGTASTALAVTVDTTAPGAPTVVSFSPDTGTVGDGITTANVLTLTGTAEANAAVKVYDGATLLGTATANGSGAWSYTTTSLSTSTHNFTATATDAAGNTGSASAALAVTVTQAAGAPIIASFSTDSGTVGDGITNDNTLTLTGTAVANSTVTVYDGATQLGTATANGSGAWSYATGTLANGSHSFTATDTVSGTTSAASAALSVTVDTTAPATPAIASFSTDSGTVGDGITNDNTPRLTGTAEANSTVKVYDGATLLGTATANGSGAWSYTTAALANGAHSLTATASDAAGNTSTASSALSITVDTVAPIAPTIASFSPDTGTVGDGVTNANVLTLTGTAEANATVKVYDGATLLGSATANGSGAWSYTTTSLSTATHSFTATASDTAGNTGAASAALAVTVVTAPGVPTIASFSTDSGTVGDGITNDSMLTLAGTAVANSTVNVYDGATLLGSATAHGNGTWSYTTAALTNGGHSFTATDTVAGTTSTASSALSVTVDTVAPVVTDHLTNDTGSSSSDKITSSAALAGVGDPNAVVHFTVDGSAVAATATANASGAWSFTPTGLSDGTHTIVASETDAAGNTGSASLSFILDTQAPAITVGLAHDTGASSTDKMTSNASLAGTGDPNAVVHFTIDGNAIAATATANASGAWSFAPTGLADGTHTIMATETDAAGNIGTSNSLIFGLDTTAPLVPTIASFSPDTGAVGDGVTTANILTLTGTAETNKTIKIYDGTTLLGSTVTNGAGAWSFITGQLANGSHDFTATATDLAGNISAASADLGATVDAPQIPLTVDSYAWNPHLLALLGGTSEANSAISLFDGDTGQSLGNTVTAANGTWSILAVGISNAVHSFTATATDQSGNTGTLHVIEGTTGNDTITSTAAGETLFGNGGNDTFVFSANFGNDTIADFNASTDVLQIDHNVFSNFAAVMSHATQAGTDVVITADPHNSITLHNTSLAQLNNNDLHIV